MSGRAPAPRALPDAVIFDCDGTLVDSETLGLEVMTRFLAELGLQLELADALERYAGLKMSETVRRLESRFERALPEGFVPELRERMARAFEERLQPVPGAREILERIPVPMCVASNGPRQKMDLTLEVTGLRRFFGDRIYSAYEVGAWKPDPLLLLHAAEQLGVAPRRTALVEDSETGVQAGRAAGMRVFHLTGATPPRGTPRGVVRITRLQELGELWRLAD